MFTSGVAITLTAASTVFFAELFWTPGSMLQAEDRVHRIGQLSPVSVTYFLGENTVDEVLWPMLQKKMKTLGELFEGERNVKLVAEDQDQEKEKDQEKDQDQEEEEEEEIAEELNLTGDDRLAGEVAGLVEDISLEEEQKLLRRETEDEPVENDDNDNNETENKFENNLDLAGSVSNQGADSSSTSTSLLLDDKEFEYDGLAQAMLKFSADDSLRNSELMLIEDESDDFKPPVHDVPRQQLQHLHLQHQQQQQHQHCNVQESLRHVVDLVDDDCAQDVASSVSVVGPGARAQQHQQQPEYICIDLNSDSDDDANDDDNDDDDDDQICTVSSPPAAAASAAETMSSTGEGKNEAAAKSAENQGEGRSIGGFNTQIQNEEQRCGQKRKLHEASSPSSSSSPSLSSSILPSLPPSSPSS